MKIFYGEKDIDYDKSKEYAFLNWRFDDSMGTNNKENPTQIISDNFEMGKAYISNAIIALFAIVYNKNSSSVADTLVFPILFNTWHGIELWLKSSIHAIRLLTNAEGKVEKNHDIYHYMDILKTELHKLNMKRTAEIALVEVEELVNEFERVDAHCDFARYSFNKQGNYQFYNAPAGDNIQWQKELVSDETVPNTCVDLGALLEIVLGIAKNFKDFVEFLTLVIIEGGQLTDDAYEMHLKICKNFEKNLDDKLDEETDPMKLIMKWIYLYIL